tara:strand:+ start:82 stop:672 length:591 start_codon:yes stop_codon:yes gene_type:complete
MLNFSLAFFFLIITPGPGVLSVAGIGSAYGYKIGIRYILGLCLGTNLVALVVVSGLAATLLATTYLRPTLMVFSTLYLLFLAYKIASAGAEISFSKNDIKPGIIAGILLQLINPKAYVVNTAMFTGFLIYPNQFALEVILKFLIMNVIWFPIHILWLYLGVSLRKLKLSERTQRKINVFMAISLVFVVVLAIFSSF